MAVEKLNIPFNNQINQQENIDKIKDKINEMIDTPAGSEVVANPEGEATEDLAKLGIDGVVYGVGGGKKYLHRISFASAGASANQSCNCYINIINNDAQSISTFQELAKALYDINANKHTYNYPFGVICHSHNSNLSAHKKYLYSLASLLPNYNASNNTYELQCNKVTVEFLYNDNDDTIIGVNISNTNTWAHQQGSGYPMIYFIEDNVQEL